MKSGEAYCPEEGDIIWLDFEPTKGHEQSGRRPALVLSPRIYNEARLMCLVCPITSSVRGFPFETPLPEMSKIQGAILTDQIKSVSWSERGSRFACTTSHETLLEARAKLKAILGIE